MPDDKPVLMKELIPQDLHGREYLKPWLEKPWSPEMATEVFKKLDGAETLVGRKIGIPGDDAKAEEVAKFYETLRPSKADDYEFQLGENPDVEFIKELRAAAHDAGMSKHQLKRFIEKLTPGIKSRQDAAVAAQTKYDKEFDELSKSAHGADTEKVRTRVKNALAELCPEPFRPFVQALDNKALVIVEGVVNAVLKKYAKEDDFIGASGGGGGGGAGTTKAELIAESEKIFASEAWKNFQHPEHDKAVKRVKEIYDAPVFKE
jgi:hypothetical protein